MQTPVRTSLFDGRPLPALFGGRFVPLVARGQRLVLRVPLGGLVVGQTATVRAQVREGRVVEKVGDAPGVNVGVALHLSREEALVLAGAHEGPPVLVHELARGLGKGGDVLVEGGETRAEGRHLLFEGLGLVAVRLAVALVQALTLQALRRELRLQLLLLLHQPRETGLCVGERPERLDLLLQLPHHEGRAPPQHLLRDVDVHEQVVAHVQDLLPPQPERPFHEWGVAAHVHAVLLQRAVFVLPQQAVVALDAEGRHVDRKEVRLPRPHDGEVEEVPPRHVVGEEAVEGVRQHGLGVAPLGVGNQQQLLPGALLIEKGEGHLRVEVHEPLRVLDDGLLEPPLHVGLVERMLYALPEIGVAHGALQRVGVEQVHQLHVHAGRRDGEKRVEEVPAVLPEVYERALILVALSLVAEGGGAVEGPLDVPEPVGLHYVAALDVDHKAADGQLRVKLQIVHRPALLLKALPNERVGSFFPLAHVVVDERVVHVVPDGLNAPQVEGTVAEEAPGGIGGVHETKQVGKKARRWDGTSDRISHKRGVLRIASLRNDQAGKYRASRR